MAQELLALSRQELDRLAVIQRVARGELKQVHAAELLGRSVRQVRRLLRRYQAQGEAGLMSGHRQRPANNRLSDARRTQIVKLIRDHYEDFGPTLATEKLAERHDIVVSVESVRQLMMQAGLWRGRRRRRANPHQLRERRACFGELIQVDGSLHDWFEGRGPRCTLIVFIDDATSSLLASFWPAETTEAYMMLLRQYLDVHGRPLALYSDQHSIFRAVHDNEASLTQFGRVLETLDIEAIQASTPQAKGRVERTNRTFQDRLVKELRLHDISDIEAANVFLAAGYLTQFNQRFSVPARIAVDAHREVQHSEAALDLIFTHHDERVVSKSAEVRYENAIYQLKGSRIRHLVGRRVTVCKGFDGRVTLLSEGRILTYERYSKGQPRPQPVDAKVLNPLVDRSAEAARKPGKHHPWRNFKIKSEKQKHEAAQRTRG